MLSLALLFASTVDPTAVPSKIEEVTLYGDSALVRREARLSGGGTFVLEGLPIALDRSNVRVRCEGGDVANVEVRERILDKTPNERMQALRARTTALRRELDVLEDERKVLQSMREHLQQLMKLDLSTHSSDVQTGKSSVEAWGASYEFLAQRLAANTSALRELQWKIEEKSQAIQAVETELGRIQGGGAVHVYDVVADVVGESATVLEVEYFVGSTGWEPAYDLRTAKDLSNVELTYRARVWQHTGEDWDDVEVSLSTARPQKGAQGPELSPVWLSLWQPAPAFAARTTANDQLKGLGYLGEAASASPSANGREPAPPRPFASVENEGLSVRFKLARRESIESRDLPTTVLVGRGDLAITPERYTAPSLDPTVWLRARAKNTSRWTLLPGTAAVFFGADFVGNALLEAVQTGQEFTLALGADPGVTVERTQIDDLSKGPGFLSSTSSKIEGWRIHLENHGTVGANADGSVDVIVREVLPRTRDERIDVKLSRAEPKPSSDARWRQDMEEKGIQTWVVRVPKSGKSDVVFQMTIDHPEDARIVRN